ncbi:M24 family metallopeptidase [Mycobacterium sp. 21AC1]|uniref:M24 family metallopeptidase n=1 Tax=[Mycobacterium] appelbergii TaxID=2939269 RepID=UPI002938DD64|nr:M24 family metallopeptidase [Mycobacterium sp. 21AC1]MDV3123997.1 M24 family metallopeptidase [Mycobacterium sp. 21AC1]
MPFDSSEYRQRREKAARLAREAGFAALLITDPSNLYYLTGYNAWSFYMPQFLLLSAHDAGVLFVAREMDARGAHRTAYLSTEEILGYPESTVHRRELHPFDWVAKELHNCGWVQRLSGGQVAIEGDGHYFSVRSYLALRDGIPEWEFADGRGIVNWLRLVKSDAEIELMRNAGRVVTNAMAVAVDAIAAGVPQHRVAAAIAHAQVAGIDEIDGDYPAIVPMLPTGEAADTPHLTWTARKFGDSETVAIEIAGAHCRYHTPLARTVAIGSVPRELDRLAGLTVEGLTLAIDAIRPGLTAGEIADVYWRFLEKHSLVKNSRLGYSIGIGYPPDWGEGTVSIRREDTTVLEPNMTFHFIAGMWLQGHSCEFSESLRVTERGTEVFTQAPRRLIRRS